MPPSTKAVSADWLMEAIIRYDNGEAEMAIAACHIAYLISGRDPEEKFMRGIPSILPPKEVDKTILSAEKGD